ncbi:hypothetical protein E5D57_006351 [Metarhizium anisopliae]|nr:hypothetical protein E5D57_006351 [Metarhizium anisopliae]
MATCPILRSGPSITNFYGVSDRPDGNELWDLESEDQECELMLFGEVTLQTKDGQSLVVPWAGHAVLKKDETGRKRSASLHIIGSSCKSRRTRPERL